jgi:UDP-N-acetylglucosamine--N-acetylmuramyl-(pentapeptide) pyrophosphoryl-undecaprenol N-acetylglucosamine transferase
MNLAPRILISGGGTGGHVFPAIAIADAIRLLVPNAQILFVGAFGKIEMEKVPLAGYPIKGLWISGIDRKSVVKNLLFPIKLVISLVVSVSIMLRFRPNLAIGVGGYASGPSLAVAHWFGVPYILQEQNAFPGITNKILKKSAQKICVAYPGMEKYFPADKIVLTGNPVRKIFQHGLTLKSQAMQFFAIPENLRVILIVGGSLGAASINRTLRRSFDEIAANPQIFWIWQTGKLYFQEIGENIMKKPDNLIIIPFLDRMDMAYAAADLVIGRAGALTISELIHVSKPAILVPSPNVAEDHQTRNAESFEKIGGGEFIPDELIWDNLISRAISLVNNKELLDKYSASLKKVQVSDAAESIAKLSVSLLKIQSHE